MTSKSKHTGSAISELFVLAVLLACMISFTGLTLFLLFGEIHAASTFDTWVLRLVLFCQAYSAVHSFGYFINVRACLKGKRNHKPALTEDRTDLPAKAPPCIAVVVCSYKEPVAVLENTLVCFFNIAYPNKRLYFLDDTRYELPNWSDQEKAAYRKSIDSLCEKYSINLFRRKWRGAKAGIINDFLSFQKNGPHPDFEMHYAKDETNKNTPKYLIVFDADQNPLPDFADSLVEELEANDKLAFVQTPQYYSNFEQHIVARLSGLQQAVFYEYICEGKSLRDSIFCCGTNVMLRIEALNAVGGFDEKSITEDCATSMLMHTQGWHSKYLNKVLAFGEGPRDLASYFSQQNRWALGSTALFRKVLSLFFKNPRSLPPRVWWEYVLSTTHYFVGWITLANPLLISLYLFTGTPQLLGYPPFVLALSLPYLLLTLGGFFWSLQRKGYKIYETWLATLLTFISFPVYIKATIYGIMGKKSKFVVTPKEGKQSLPLKGLLPQLSVGTLCFGAAVWGLHRAYFEVDRQAALLVGVFWALYFSVICFSILFVNALSDDEA